MSKKRFWAAMKPKSKVINHILEGPEEPTAPASMFGSHTSDDPTIWVEVAIIPMEEYDDLQSTHWAHQDCGRYPEAD